MSIYEGFYGTMLRVMNDLTEQIERHSREHAQIHGEPLYEHLKARIKGDESMREKLIRMGFEPTARNALRAARDSIGLRIVCLFIDDVYDNVRLLRSLPGCTVVEEKDYIRNAKPNGYRSYHMILEVTADGIDVEGRDPGRWYAEIQLRTIAMDTWAALEHELKYKKDIADPELIAAELRRCANELASCDVSMQTLRRLIREG